MKLIVGLGNPGLEYALSPHNLGFMAVDRLAEGCGAKVAKREAQSLTGKGTLAGQAVLLAKPQTYMNLSGAAVARLLARYSIEPEEMVVLFDDLDLPLGMIRIRRQGTAGGHNGMKSIIGAIQADEFIRVRMGIQPDSNSPLEEATPYLLGNFRRRELRAVSDLLDQAVDAVHMILREGPRKAMNRFNRRVAAASNENGG
ncbi:MAG: aminoacyl-tRNA hydrolase [Acidobacteriota bacterium]